MARSCPCRCWPRYCDGDRARRLSQVPPICGVPPLVLSGCCIDLRMRVVAQRGMGEKYSTNDTAHSLAHTVDSVVYSDSVLHNARLLSRLTTCGAAWWAWATGLSLSCRHRLCVDQEMGGAHTLTHTRTHIDAHSLRPGRFVSCGCGTALLPWPFAPYLCNLRPAGIPAPRGRLLKMGGSVNTAAVLSGIVTRAPPTLAISRHGYVLEHLGRLRALASLAPVSMLPGDGVLGLAVPRLTI